MSNFINIKKIIDVSTSLPPVSLLRRDFSRTIFIQQGSGYNNGEVRSYTTSGDVANDLGSNSQAYKASLKFFAGGFNGIKPSIFYVGLVNTSQVVVSTRGNFTSGVMDTNLANFQAIIDGEFKISIDGGTAIEIKNIDLTDVTSLENLVETLSNFINVAGIKNIDISYDSNVKKVISTSRTYGSTSSVSITSITDGTGTDLTGANYLNGGSTTAGVSGTQATTISNFLKNTSYYHIILDNAFTQAQQLEWAQAVESSTKYAYTLWLQTNTADVKNTSLINDTGTIAKIALDRKWKRTFIVYTDDLTSYTQASFVSYFAIVDFTPARPLGCLAHKQFSDAIASDLTDTNWDNLVSKNVNFYGVYGESGRLCAEQGKTPNGNFINDVILADWIDYNVTYNIFDWAISKNKIAYISSDFAELRQSIEQILVSAVAFGAIAGGNDPDSGETLANGYKITIPTPNSISQSDKSVGLLKGVQIVALTSGNIVKIVITNTLKI